MFNLKTLVLEYLEYMYWLNLSGKGRVYTSSLFEIGSFAVDINKRKCAKIATKERAEKKKISNSAADRPAGPVSQPGRAGRGRGWAYTNARFLRIH